MTRLAQDALGGLERQIRKFDIAGQLVKKWLKTASIVLSNITVTKDSEFAEKCNFLTFKQFESNFGKIKTSCLKFFAFDTLRKFRVDKEERLFKRALTILTLFES